jgi:hypothetical protein
LSGGGCRPQKNRIGRGIGVNKKDRRSDLGDRADGQQLAAKLFVTEKSPMTRGIFSVFSRTGANNRIAACRGTET